MPSGKAPNTPWLQTRKALCALHTPYVSVQESSRMWRRCAPSPGLGRHARLMAGVEGVVCQSAGGATCAFILSKPILINCLGS